MRFDLAGVVPRRSSVFIRLGGITMRYTAILLGTLMLFAASACKTGQRVNSRGPVMDTTFVEVPLPASTPFDYFADARDSYFEGYREGYRSGMPAFLNPYARVGVADPRSAGWHDGAFAARLPEAMRIKKEWFLSRICG